MVQICSNWGVLDMVNQSTNPFRTWRLGISHHFSRQYHPHGASKCTRRALPTRAGRAHWGSTWIFSKKAPNGLSESSPNGELRQWFFLLPWHKLVGGLEHLDYFPIVGMMIQSDELIFFRGVGPPPTSKNHPKRLHKLASFRYPLVN